MLPDVIQYELHNDAFLLDANLGLFKRKKSGEISVD